MFVSADMFCLLAFNIAYAGLGQSNNLFNFSEPWMEDADITDETQRPYVIQWETLISHTPFIAK